MKRIINILLTILFAFVYYYFAMPAINIHSVSFYLFIILIIICFTVLNNLLSVIESLKKGKTKPVKEYTMLIIPLIIVLVIIWNIIESPLFMASKYAKRIEIDTGKNFSTDISEVDFSKLPLLDKKSSQALGDRVMGQMRDLVSQYNVSDIYTQINYNERIIRVMKNVSIKMNETEKEQAIARYIESIVNSDVSEEQKVAMLKHAEELRKYM